MKLILSSAGFYTQEIVDKCVQLVGKPKDQINFSVINEAYAVEHGDHKWVLNDLNGIKNNFGGRMELVNLLALDLDKVEERIRQADVLFVVGGHTDYLMRVFDKTGFSKLLPELLKDKVYVGSSAGSMVLGERISTEANAKIYGEETDYGMNKYLNLVEFALKPHMGSKLFPNNRNDILLDVAKDFTGTVYGLSDDAAIVIDGSKIEFIGSSPTKIVNGKLQS